MFNLLLQFGAIFLFTFYDFVQIMSSCCFIPCHDEFTACDDCHGCQVEPDEEDDQADQGAVRDAHG